jgi:hypothetical protein
MPPIMSLIPEIIHCNFRFQLCNKLHELSKFKKPQIYFMSQDNWIICIGSHHAETKVVARMWFLVSMGPYEYLGSQVGGRNPNSLQI